MSLSLQTVFIKGRVRSLISGNAYISNGIIMSAVMDFAVYPVDIPEGKSQSEYRKYAAIQIMKEQ